MALTKEDVLKFYNERKSLYVNFVNRLEEKLENELKTISLHTIPVVSGRVKSELSLWNKVQLKNYENLEKEFTDFAGLRIVVNDLDEVDKVCDYIRATYIIDKANSVDKREKLAPDQVGYLSVHFIVSFNDADLKARENQAFAGLKAEIQVRTRLQHAWAELTHDKIYKDKRNLDEKDNLILRRVSLMAGLLELADREFVEINAEVAKRANESITIDITTLNLFMRNKFKEAIFINAEQCVQELKELNITKIEDLNKLITEKLFAAIDAITEIRSYDGIIRNILIIHDAEAYFSIPSSRKEISRVSKKLYKKFDIPLAELKEKYKLNIEE